MKFPLLQYLIVFFLVFSICCCGPKIVCKECGKGKNFIPKAAFRPFFKKNIKCDEKRKLFKPFDKKRRVVQYKPVIYLYPQKTDTINVQLHYKGDFIATYPEYNNGWRVVADSLGNLKDPNNGKKYYCLFWEGKTSYSIAVDYSKGFVVRGDSTVAFLETTLAQLGLNDRGANEFIIFWLPLMKNNSYNYITFIGKEYEDLAPLEIEPRPDAILRVYMMFKPLNKVISVSPQTFPVFKRKGFTVVEWGGSELSEPK